MELSWLEDFLALAEQRNFSRAAAARSVTQPAFSRRIQALEAWIGTKLVLRSPQRVALTAAGEHLREPAAALLRELQQARRGARRAAGLEGAALSIAATHALSFTFFPGWMRGLPPLQPAGRLNLVSDTMAASERLLLAGDADLLLCHHHEGAPNRLSPAGFASRAVGADLLLPVAAPDRASGAAGRPRWTLAGPAARPVPLLAYSEASGLGRILDAARPGFPALPALETVFTSPLAAALQTMARQGQGLAWLPRTMAAEDLAAGRLVEAGGEGHHVAVEIRLFRPLRPLSAIAESFWAASRPAGPG
ncbi:LysR family transcriptional regulator [Pseudoroseomonas cervicalis]|uniref:LysR family transcriptional regulator n=1 Tax=Teichococcus cervicalis TaxID=204525 RepID=UPI002784D9EB|nr:LysR family transcriptional regulator [Pseudoroseomonas cervicalis]MDQ1079450.1 DNA-binding transcriptional LysR family regulator [Pseudoroseomonas cervicalis]